MLTERPSGAVASNAAEDLSAVERVLAGEVQAFEGIVRRWQGPLVNMAWRYCRDRGRAEELAQEAFVRAWRGLRGWRREGSFSTWLFALAANVFRSELKRFPTVDVPLEEVAEPSRPAAQHQALAEQLSSETVRRAVLTLPMRYREPVVLFYFYEMDVAAASVWGAVEFVRMGVPVIMAQTLSMPDVSFMMTLPLRQTGWVALALGISLASWLLARRMMGRSEGP